MTQTKKMRPIKCYICALLNIIFCVLWIVVWLQVGPSLYLERSPEQRCGCNQVHKSTNSATLIISFDHNDTHLSTLSKRPLLVRFDWYSRKRTPIHIGYCTSSSMTVNVVSITCVNIFQPSFRNYTLCMV